MDEKTRARWHRPKQTWLRENGVCGDCWRCCVAAILNLPAEDVPHFVHLHGSSCDVETQRWLNGRGFALVQVEGGNDWPTGFQFPRHGGDPAERLPAIIAAGPTVRSKKPGDHHAVVMRAGEMLYDPHPSNAGLLYVAEQYMIVAVPAEVSP